MYNVYAFCQILLRNLMMTLNIASKGLIYPFAFNLVICCCTRKKGLYKKKNVSRLNLLLVVLNFCKHIYHAHLTLVANSTWLADVCAKTKSFFSCEQLSQQRLFFNPEGGVFFYNFNFATLSQSSFINLQSILSVFDKQCSLLPQGSFFKIKNCML